MVAITTTTNDGNYYCHLPDHNDRHDGEALDASTSTIDDYSKSLDNYFDHHLLSAIGGGSVDDDDCCYTVDCFGKSCWAFDILDCDVGTAVIGGGRHTMVVTTAAITNIADFHPLAYVQLAAH